MSDKFVIRTSDRFGFKRCRQSWDFGSKIRQNWEYTPGIEALDFGTAIHAALEMYYSPELWGHPEVQKATSDEAFLAAMTEWRKRLASADQLEMQRERYEELLLLGVGMLNNYYEWAAEADKHYRPVKSEIEFEVPIPYPKWLDDYNNRKFSPSLDGNMMYLTKPVVYQGRIDLVLEDERNGLIWILDHKTAASFGQQGHLELDPQCSSYAWALQRALGIEVHGIIYSELRKAVPHSPAVLKNGELSKNRQQMTTVALYRKAIQDNGLDPANYEDFLADFPGGEYFRREYIGRSKTELATAEQNIQMEAIDMLDDPMIYPNPGKFNCNGCQFRTPCLMKQDGSDYDWHLSHSGLYNRRGNLD